MSFIDLRSDTVTKPSAAMRTAMAEADVGDDVYGEDPTVNRLEKVAADLMGMEAAIFCASGTQSNLLALLCHCRRGDGFIAGRQSHAYQYEGGGAAALGSIHAHPLDFEADATLNLEKVAEAVPPDDVHFAPMKLLCLENTQRGRVLPLAYIKAARELADSKKLSFQLDGARVFNAAVKLNVPVGEITGHFDSVSFCLSKGLGTPVGSLLCGTAELIHDARRWRKTLGGGMRQAGILAAAGLYALENNIDRLAEDHANAALLAQRLEEMDELTVNPDDTETSMVYVDVGETNSEELREFLRRKGVLIQGAGKIRLVTHLDIGENDIATVVDAFKAFYRR